MTRSILSPAGVIRRSGYLLIFNLLTGFVLPELQIFGAPVLLGIHGGYFDRMGAAGKI